MKGIRAIAGRVTRNPALTLLIGVVAALPVAGLAQVSLPHTFAPNTRISAAQVNANFTALNNGKLDGNKVVAFIHTHTAAIADCNNMECSRLPAVVQGVEDLVITATVMNVAGGGAADQLTNQPVYVRRYSNPAYYELYYGDGSRPFPVGLRVSVIAIRP